MNTPARSAAPAPDRISYTLREAGALVGASSDAIRMWCQRHGLPTVKVGRRVLVMRADLLAFLEARRTTGGS